MIRKYQNLLNEIDTDRKNQENIHRDSKVLIVDGMNLFIRTFSAIPTLNEDGQHIGGLSGFLKSLAATIRMVNPTRVVVVFDGKGGSHRRRKIYSNYKEGRATKSRLNRIVGFEDIDDEQRSMKHQMFRVFSYLQNLPITIITIDNIEADDVIAYLTSYFKEKSVILSNDRDFLQLVSDRVNVYLPTKKKMYTPENLLEETGIWCENFIIYKSLLGDKSDNIKGINGIGEKTILKNFPMLSEKTKINLENFVQFCILYDGKLKAMNELKNNIEVFKTNYEIMQLHDVDIAQTYKSNIRQIVDGEIQSINKIELDKLFIQDKMQSAIMGWDEWLKKNFTNLNMIRNKYAG
jgi:DNA polymerase-1